MLEEWIRTLRRYLAKANNVLAKDINGNTFTKWSQIKFHLVFCGCTLVIVWLIPKGLNSEFIDYIKDIFAIFVGFFVTVLCFVFDKLDTEKVLTQEENDKKKAEDRNSSKRSIKIKQEHNYTVRFFYTIGLIILYSTAVLCLLIPNIFWKEWFDVDIRDYEVVTSFEQITISSIMIFAHLLFCVVYRITVVLLTIKVFYYTVYSVSSLLQVLINKKKLESWS